MNCSDLQDSISQHIDGGLSVRQTSAVDDHLAVCPLCRQAADDLRGIKLDLRQLARPSLTVGRQHALRMAMREAARKNRALPFSPLTLDWIQMRLMPLTVGLTASLLVGVTFLGLMMSGGRAIDQYAAIDRSENSSVLIARGPVPRPLGRDDISPMQFARNREAVAGDSPSINPQGTLAALSDTLRRNGIRNDEVVVVADVFSNGLARIAEVVEPSHDARVIDELQRALDTDLSDAPFVPASMDNRSESVRVVLKFQSVQVHSGGNRKRH